MECVSPFLVNPRQADLSHLLSSILPNITSSVNGCRQVNNLHALPALAVELSTTVLLSELIVLLVKLSALLLESLKVLVLVSNLLLEAGDLAGITGGGKLLALLGVLLGTLVGAELVLQAHDLDNHDVGAVQDEREEEGESAKVHVALGVELACLDLETLVTHDSATVRGLS